MRTFDVDLPSRGLFGTPAVVNIREMNLKEKKVLYNKPRFEQIVKMVGDCITDKSIRIKDVYLADYMTLFVNLRVLTMGDNYSFPIRCKQCGYSQTIELALSDIEMLEVADGSEPTYDIDITDDSGAILHTYTLKHLTVQDQITLNKRITKKKSGRIKFTEGDEVIFGLANSIVAIDGEPVVDPGMIITRLENMPSSESDILEDGKASQDFGLRFSVAHECHNCYHSTTYPINITSEFFFRTRDYGTAHRVGS